MRVRAEAELILRSTAPEQTLEFLTFGQKAASTTFTLLFKITKRRQASVSHRMNMEVNRVHKIKKSKF